MNKNTFIWALSFGMTSVILGAFGAHILKQHLSVAQLASFETGVRYQMFHALLLLWVAGTDKITEKIKKKVQYLTNIGVILFSGSIYILSTSPLTGLNIKPIGIITPIGGIFLITSWIVLIFYFLGLKKEN